MIINRSYCKDIQEILQCKPKKKCRKNSKKLRMIWIWRNTSCLSSVSAWNWVLTKLPFPLVESILALKPTYIS